MNTRESFCALLSGWLLMSGTGTATEQLQADPALQPLESIRTAAERHVAASMPQSADRIEAAATALDQRLRLPACNSKLQTETPYGDARGNRITVRVSCADEPQWRVHVPVELTRTGNVVSVARAMPRGAVLSVSDLVIVESRLDRLGHGYFQKAEAVLGQRLKRPLAAGDVIVPAVLETPAAIERGQNVTIVAAGGGIDIKMSGTALQDGALGQVIAVRNGSSGRRVEGIVRSSRSVEVLLR